ncbi:MAG: tetratricopeptide repeat protein [Bryobacteraceae bacterium]
MKHQSAPLWCLIVVTGMLGLAAQQASNDSLRLPSAAAASQPSRPNLSFEQRGDIFMARKMYREAVEVYQKGPADSAIVANKIGIAYHQLTFLPQARKQYERAQKIDPAYAEAINNLGTVYYAQKNYRKAIGQYKKALKLNPGSASIHSNLGTAHFARRKYADAFAEYQTALSLDPEVFEHRNSHGVLLQERSVEERAKFHFYLAKTYAKSGQVERALMYIRKAIEEGFKERDKFAEDSDFRSMQQLPEFQELMKLETRAL